MSVFDPTVTVNRFEADYRVWLDEPDHPCKFRIYVMYDHDGEHVHGVLRDLSMGDMLAIRTEIDRAIEGARSIRALIDGDAARRESA